MVSARRRSPLLVVVMLACPRVSLSSVLALWLVPSARLVVRSLVPSCLSVGRGDLRSIVSGGSLLGVRPVVPLVSRGRSSRSVPVPSSLFALSRLGIMRVRCGCRGWAARVWVCCLPCPVAIREGRGAGVSFLRVACPRYEYRPVPLVVGAGRYFFSCRLFDFPLIDEECGHIALSLIHI